MILKLWTSLILTSILVGSSHHAYACLSPLAGKDLWGQVGGSASIPCNVLSQCPKETSEVRWFVFHASSHEELLLAPGSRFSTHGGNLTIDLLTPHDCGDYHCVVLNYGSPLQGLFGVRNTLTVRGEFMEGSWPILLWVLFTLLAIYNLVLMIIIFRKKAGPCRYGSVAKSTSSEKRPSESKRQQFRCVVQELYNRRNLQSRPDKVSTEEPPSKVSLPPNDDIYENL